MALTGRIQNISKNQNLYPHHSRIFYSSLLWDTYPVQDIDSQPENDPTNPGNKPIKSCESSSEKPTKRKHKRSEPWIRNYGLRNTLTALEKSPERSPEKSHGWFKPIENQSEEKAIKVEVTDDLGAKYLVFFSSWSLKTREKYISFAQFVYFLREVSYFSIFEW